MTKNNPDIVKKLRNGEVVAFAGHIVSMKANERGVAMRDLITGMNSEYRFSWKPLKVNHI